MSFNLLDAVRSFFTGDVITASATELGESEGNLQKALSGAIPIVIARLIKNSGGGFLLNDARQAASNLPRAGAADVNSLKSHASHAINTVFGDQAGAVATELAAFAGIRQSSASSLLQLAAPVTLGILGQQAVASQLNEGSFANLLTTQRSSVLNALPPVLKSVAGLEGVENTPGTSASTYTRHEVNLVSHHDDHAHSVSGLRQFLTPFWLGLVAVALTIFIFKGCTGIIRPEANDDRSVESNQMAEEPAAVTTSNAPATHETLKVKLPNDTLLEAYKGGIEDQLVAFLQSDYKKLGEDSLKNRWFDFDNLTFKTASAEITEESQRQVNNLAAILKAFPSVKLKIGGYTDKTGNETANKTLSDQRAKAVQAALSKAGVGSQITGAEGYGSAFAAFPAAAAENERVKDRRVSVSVR